MKQVSCYTDISVVLSWINGEPANYKVFVGNRISEIQGLVSKEQWYHCPGILNPADMASRGLSGPEMVSATEWFYGPEWLRTQISCPTSEEWTASVSNPDIELKATSTLLSPQMVSMGEEVFHAFGSLQKVIRFVGWMRRFSTYLKNKVAKQDTTRGPLTAAELEVSQTHLWRWVQQIYYSSERQRLVEGKQILRSSSLLHLNPFMDKEGQLLISGRLHHANLPYGQKYPIIIPKGYVAELLI